LKIGILIPAYNEAEHIEKLVREINSMGFSPTVIDDGSSDGTSDKARSGGARVIQHEQNMGKGTSLKTGFSYMLDEGYDAALIMDGDAQHSPADIHKFIRLAEETEGNTLLIGNRMIDTKNMPLDRKLTNMFMSFLTSLICGQKIPDTQCGFRLIKKETLENITIESSRFEVESEILIKASRIGTKVLSVPIETLYKKEESQINPFWDTWRFIIFLLKLPFMK
jgi:glycosyltransferase involved in cell wall biosynthesis